MEIEVVGILSENMLRLIRKSNYQFIIGVLFQPLLMIIIQFSVIKFTNWGNVGLIFGMLINYIITIAIYLVVYFEKKEEFWRVEVHNQTISIQDETIEMDLVDRVG